MADTLDGVTKSYGVGQEDTWRPNWEAHSTSELARIFTNGMLSKPASNRAKKAAAHYRDIC